MWPNSSRHDNRGISCVIDCCPLMLNIQFICIVWIAGLLVTDIQGNYLENVQAASCQTISQTPKNNMFWMNLIRKWHLRHFIKTVSQVRWQYFSFHIHSSVFLVESLQIHLVPIKELKKSLKQTQTSNMQAYGEHDTVFMKSSWCQTMYNIYIL